MLIRVLAEVIVGENKLTSLVKERLLIVQQFACIVSSIAFFSPALSISLIQG